MHLTTWIEFVLTNQENQIIEKCENIPFMNDMKSLESVNKKTSLRYALLLIYFLSIVDYICKTMKVPISLHHVQTDMDLRSLQILTFNLLIKQHR